MNADELINTTPTTTLSLRGDREGVL